MKKELFKKAIGILSIILLTNCSPKAQPCINSVPFGDINICLPIIKGMKESYSIPIVKERADKFNYIGNSILAYYIDDASYNLIDKFNDVTIGESFQLFATDKMKGLEVGEKELDYVANMMTENYLKKSWDEVEKTGEDIYGNISLDSPIIIDSYSLNNKVRSYIILTKFQVNDQPEAIMISIMHFIIIKDRMIDLSYFKVYDSEETIKLSKIRNNSFVLELLSKNK